MGGQGKRSQCKMVVLNFPHCDNHDWCRCSCVRFRFSVRGLRSFQMLKNEAYLVGDIGTPIKQSFLRLPEFELLYTVRPEIIVVMIKSCPLFKHGETECSYSSAGSCKLQHCDEIISWCTTCCRATSLYGVTQLSSSLSAFARLFTHVPSSPGPAGTSLQEKVFPKKLGEPLCQYYMRNGDAKFGLVCRYHHPQVHVVARPVLSPVGLPLRPI